MTAARRTPPSHLRGNGLLKFMVVVALGIAGYKFGKPYFDAPPSLMIKNESEVSMDGVVVQISLPDEFDKYGKHLAPVELGQILPGGSSRTPLDVDGRASIHVTYQSDFKDHAAGRVMNVQEGLDLLLEVRRPGAHEFTEGNGVW